MKCHYQICLTIAQIVAFISFNTECQPRRHCSSITCTALIFTSESIFANLKTFHSFDVSFLFF